MRYDPEALKPALTELLQVAPSLRTSASYRYDLTDLTRQVLANESRRLLPLIRSAYESKDRAAFKKRTDQWMTAITWEDRLLSTNEYFLLGRWLSYVPEWSSSPADLVQIEYDAHSILTTWGDRTASNELHEYANRDWAGLVSDYYAPRWKLYFDSLEQALNTGAPPKPIDWFAFGDAWNRSTKHYSTEPVGDTYSVSESIAEFLNLLPKEKR
jgi:alpha-N-acetylglucosaminidase